MPPILALFVLPLVLAASPLSLVGPLTPILLMPARRLAGFPLVPVSRLGMVVPRWYEQDRTRDELGSDDDPRAIVSRTHIPCAVQEGPILAAVEEEICGICLKSRRGRHVLDLRRLGDDNQRGRGGEMDADVDVHLSADGRSHHDSQERAEHEDVHRASRDLSILTPIERARPSYNTKST